MKNYHSTKRADALPIKWCSLNGIALFTIVPSFNVDAIGMILGGILRTGAGLGEKLKKCLPSLNIVALH